jgi:hypothetical protein
MENNKWPTKKVIVLSNSKCGGALHLDEESDQLRKIKENNNDTKKAFPEASNWQLEPLLCALSLVPPETNVLSPLLKSFLHLPLASC